MSSSISSVEDASSGEEEEEDQRSVGGSERGEEEEEEEEMEATTMMMKADPNYSPSGAEIEDGVAGRVEVSVGMELRAATPELLMKVRKALLKGQKKWLATTEILDLLQFGEVVRSSCPVPKCPPSGSVWFFDRRQVASFRKDGYTWKKKKGSKHSVREDHVKLKVDKIPRVYACHVHSDVVETFHRRLYWELPPQPSKGMPPSEQIPLPLSDGVIVHYLDTNNSGSHETSCCCLDCTINHLALEQGIDLPPVKIDSETAGSKKKGSTKGKKRNVTKLPKVAKPNEIQSAATALLAADSVAGSASPMQHSESEEQDFFKMSQESDDYMPFDDDLPTKNEDFSSFPSSPILHPTGSNGVTKTELSTPTPLASMAFSNTMLDSRKPNRTNTSSFQHLDNRISFSSPPIELDTKMDSFPTPSDNTWASAIPIRVEVVDLAPTRLSISGGEKILICFTIIDDMARLAENQNKLYHFESYVLFETTQVPTEVVAPGVVRCFSPPQRAACSMTIHLVINGVADPGSIVTFYKDEPESFTPRLPEHSETVSRHLNGIRETYRNSQLRRSKRRKPDSENIESDGEDDRAGKILDVSHHDEIVHADVDTMGEKELSEHSNAMLDKIVQLLLDYVSEYPALSSEVNALDASGYNLLHYTVLYNKGNLLEKLLKHGSADANYYTSVGDTALHLAAEANHGNIVKILLKYGADPTVVDAKGRLPHQVAWSNNHTDIANQLSALCEASLPGSGAMVPPDEIEEEMASFVQQQQLVETAESPPPHDPEIHPRRHSVGMEKSPMKQRKASMANADSPARVRLGSFSSAPVGQSLNHDEKHMALLRDALSSLTLKEQYALTLGMKGSPSTSSSGADAGASPFSSQGNDSSMDESGEKKAESVDVRSNTIQRIMIEAESKPILEAVMNLPNEERALIEHEASKIQASVRKWMLRRNYLLMKEATVRLQGATKDFLRRKQQKLDAAVTLQAAARGSLARRNFRDLRQRFSTSIVIQKSMPEDSDPSPS